MKALIVLLLTLSPSWSVPVGDLKHLDHNHTNPDRNGKLHFSHNEFDLGDIDVDGNISGEEISIGHGVDILIKGSMYNSKLAASHTHTSNASHAHSHKPAGHYRPPYYHHPTELAAPSEPIQTFQDSCQNSPFAAREPRFLATAVHSIANFVIGEKKYFDGMFSSQDSHEEVISKLNEIKAIATATQNGVNELLIAADFMDYQLHVLAGPHRKILGQFNQISKLTRLNANQKQWIDWAEEVVDDNHGTAWALSEINRQITSNNVIDTFKNKAAHKAASLTRTVAGSIEDFFQLQVIIQMIGYKTLEKANKHLQDCSARNYDYKLMIERFNQQVQEFNKVEASMPAISYLQNHGWGEPFSLLNVKYAHLHPVKADQGKVVTGVQLYQHGNRVAIRIKQGRVQEFGRIDSESWKDASGWGEDVNLDYIQIYEGDCHYIDLHTASVPDNHAIVGMSFYKKGNRLGVKVQAAYVDYLTGKVYPTQWISSPGWGDAYYNTEDNKYFVDTGVVETKPSGLLTAAALYLKGNKRMAIQVSDVFKPYAEGESCTKYPHVKMIGKFDCCDGYLYDKEASQKCPGNDHGPIYETPDLDCTGPAPVCPADVAVTKDCMCAGTSCATRSTCVGGSTCTAVCPADVAVTKDCMCAGISCAIGSTCVGGSTCTAACESDEEISGSACMCAGARCDVGGICTGGRTCTPEGIKPRQENIADLGYRPDCGAGWYDVQGQGVKNDYCRWVGKCGCRNDDGGDCSWWSCVLAGSNEPYSPKGKYTEPGQPAKTRTWTSWSNTNSRGYLNHAKECAEGAYVDQIRAREQGGYGIVNFNFKCSDGNLHIMNDNFNGFWDSPLTCESGFRQLTGKEQGGYGIINMRAWCEGEETSQRANENANGKWNEDLTCEAHQQVVGFEAREQDGYGIINFRFLCA